MQIRAPFKATQCLCLRPSVKPYCRNGRVRKAQIRAPIQALAVPVNPLLPLWQQPAVQQAALKAVAAAGASFIAANALSTLVGKVARKEYGPLQSVDNPGMETDKQVPLQMLETTIVAVQKPLKFLLRLVAGVFTIREIAEFLEVTLEAHAVHEHIAPSWLVEVLSKAMAGLDSAAHLALEATEVALIIFGVWVALRMKDHVVSGMLKSRVQDFRTDSISDKAFEQVVLPLSGMGSWAAVVIGALMSLHVLGINLAPLLTVGGISGIVVGLSAQAVLGNMVSGLNLYISRPFVAGERVDIMTGSGGKVLSAFVEEVSPMRTHLRDDSWRPYVIPNKVLAELVISNESRIIQSDSVSFYNRMRSYHFTAVIRYQDFDKLEGILKDYKRFMSESPHIDKSLPTHVHLGGFASDGLHINVHAHSTPSASRAYASFKQELLLEMGKCLKNNGADFAWKEHVEFTNGREALTNGSAGSDISSELASMAAS